jgi:hypothetical protein
MASDVSSSVSAARSSPTSGARSTAPRVGRLGSASRAASAGGDPGHCCSPSPGSAVGVLTWVEMRVVGRGLRLSGMSRGQVADRDRAAPSHDPGGLEDHHAVTGRGEARPVPVEDVLARRRRRSVRAAARLRWGGLEASLACDGAGAGEGEPRNYVSCRSSPRVLPSQPRVAESQVRASRHRLTAESDWTGSTPASWPCTPHQAAGPPLSRGGIPCQRFRSR